MKHIDTDNLNTSSGRIIYITFYKSFFFQGCKLYPTCLYVRSSHNRYSYIFFHIIHVRWGTEIYFFILFYFYFRLPQQKRWTPLFYAFCILNLRHTTFNHLSLQIHKCIFSNLRIKLPFCLCAIINKWSTSLPFEQNVVSQKKMRMHITYILCCAHAVK